MRREKKKRNTMRLLGCGDERRCLSSHERNPKIEEIVSWNDFGRLKDRREGTMENQIMLN